MKAFVLTLGAFALLAIAITLGLGKSGRNDSEGGGEVLPTLSLALSTRELVAGDTVWLTLWVKNPSPDTLRVTLPSPLGARFTIYRGARPVWRSDYGVMFIQVLTPLAIPPKDSIPFRSFWTGKDNAARWLPLGKYTVEACFTANKRCLVDSLWLVD